jgi:hypothetical protein
MINLDRFAKPEEIILPIVNCRGIYKGRVVEIPKLEDGWYKIITGDIPRVCDIADELELQKVFETQKTIKGMVFGTEIVPISFNAIKNKYGIEASSIPVYFINASPWQVVQAIHWEDGNLYFVGEDFSYDATILKQVKEASEKGQNLSNLRGITPEMRYLYFMFDFERETQKQLLLKQKEAELQKSFGGRLKLSIERAGGTLIRFTKHSKNRIEVVWKTGERRYNSLINADNFMCHSCGFCVDGEDKKYNLSRAVITAQEFEKEGLIHITRE